MHKTLLPFPALHYSKVHITPIMCAAYERTLLFRLLLLRPPTVSFDRIHFQLPHDQLHFVHPADRTLRHGPQPEALARAGNVRVHLRLQRVLLHELRLYLQDLQEEAGLPRCRARGRRHRHRHLHRHLRRRAQLRHVLHRATLRAPHRAAHGEVPELAQLGRVARRRVLQRDGRLGALRRYGRRQPRAHHALDRAHRRRLRHGHLHVLAARRALVPAGGAHVRDDVRRAGTY